MKLSYNWLKTYAPHALSPLALAELLTMSGLEVEDVETFGPSLEGVVVGHVLETRPHPNADRLTLCRVDIGGDVPVQIVCGAPNVAPGQKVPVATVGTTLQLPSRKNPGAREPVTIQQAKLRGETSQGMICAEDELGLSADHAGIMVLDEDAPAGASFEAYLSEKGYEASDAVLDVGITPNRPDATSHIGIARDVAALTDVPLDYPDVDLPQNGGEAASLVDVSIEDPEGCGRYAAMLVRGVKVGESPEWLKQRLTAIGLRPRNNVVDVTNFVMFECGQPLHGFDFDRLTGGRIVVRKAGSAETFTTLDSKERRLAPGTLLICDAERPVAIAGIMGGENSEVTGETVNVLIESAWFDASAIRKAARHLGLSTDASYRFERGVDPRGQVWAAARAAQLIAELTGGDVVPGVVDAHPRPFEPRHIRVRRSRIGTLLGVDIPAEDVMRLLRAIGFEVALDQPLDAIAETIMQGRLTESLPEEESFYCTAPSFRPDIAREVDVIEEIARLYGYHRIPEPAHSLLPNRTPREYPADALRRQARSLLSGLGLREIYTNSMLRRETAERFNVPALGGHTEGAVVDTLNPISQEMSALRPSLLPGLLAVAAHNGNHGQDVLRFFEFGHVFRKSGQVANLIPGYAEHETLIVGISGPHLQLGRDTARRNVDFYDLKGIVEALAERLHLPALVAEPDHAPTEVTAYHARLRAGDVEIGSLAKLSDGIASAMDLRHPVFFAELDWHVIVTLARTEDVRRYTPVSRFPVVDRDVAVLVAKAQPVGAMLGTIREAGGALLRNVSVFDLYEGKGIDPDARSVAFSLQFGADRTLTDEEVDTQMAAVLSALGSAHGATLRQ